MKSKLFVGALLTLLVVATGCRHDPHADKLVAGLTADTHQTVLPANAAQEFLLLKRDSLGEIIPVITRLGNIGSTFDELSGPDGSLRYRFTMSEKHYGKATFVIQFQDEHDNPIDPIADNSSTDTMKSVKLDTEGSSTLFTYTEDLRLTLDDPGNLSSIIRLTGTSHFVGSQYDLTFSFHDSGTISTFEGMKTGLVTAAGTGPTSSVALRVLAASGGILDGSLTWEGEVGNIHLDDDGTGFIITNQSRIFFN